MIVVTIFLFIFTNNYYDKRTAKNIVDLEKKFSKININSINTLVATTLLKVQASLNEQIIFYQKLARKTDEIINYELNNFLKCLLDIDDEYLEQNLETLKYKGFWFLDNVTREDNLISNDTIKLQLISYSNILQNVFSTLAATKSSVEAYSFYFEETNLVINFPLDYYYKNKYLEIFTKYTVNPPWCLDSKGKPLTIYNMKCRDIYNMIIKAKSDVFDLNYSDENNRTIFITNSYQQLGIAGNSSNTVFSLIIQFDDPISGGLGYAIADINQDDLLFALDNFNTKIAGYYLITSIGFNKVFYYPQMDSTSAKTATDNIFRWDRKFYLQEKRYFLNYVQKQITSNYNYYINENSTSLFDEILINGVDQSFNFNGERYYYSIFPVV